MKCFLIIPFILSAFSFLHATALGDAATLTKARAFRVLSTQGLVEGMFKISDGGNNYQPIFAYSNQGAWDPTREEMIYLGAPHQFPWKWGFPIYSASSNQWRSGNVDPYFSADVTTSHNYDRLTCDTRRSLVYWGPVCGNPKSDIRVYNLATDAWSLLPQKNPSVFDANFSANWAATGGIKYFPDINSIIYAADSRILRFNLDDSTWSVVPGSFSFTGPHNVLSYNPARHSVVVGGGNTVNRLYEVDTLLRVTALNPAPFADFGLKMVCDPVSGDVLTLQPDSLYAYSFETGTWQAVIKNPFTPYDHHRIGVVPISSYGVVAFLNTYSWPVLLYKHADSPAAVEGRSSGKTRSKASIIASPNPFNPITRIRVTGFIAQTSLSGAILDIQGRLVKSIPLKTVAGGWEGEWDAQGMPTGCYILSCGTQSQSIRKRIILAR